MDYIIRFVQMHVSFRQPETDAIADLLGLEIEWLRYTEDSPFAIIRFLNTTDPTSAAQRLISRSILSTAIYELWGSGPDYTTLHTSIRHLTTHLWSTYRTPSFRFDLDSYRGSRPQTSQRAIIESFAYMDFQGPILMTSPDQTFRIFEESPLDGAEPNHLFFGRWIAGSGRKAMSTYTLKRRKYIATTSMDAELSLVTANLAHAGLGRLAYDPFMGTGSFPLACAHFGSIVFGSDLDGRSIRGTPQKNVQKNFEQYSTTPQYLGGFVADLTNTPLRLPLPPTNPNPKTTTSPPSSAAGGGSAGYIDSITCDPPYGVREGLKVLGSTRVALSTCVYLSDGTPAHLGANYIPPKKPYSFTRMLDDILDFSAERLVRGGGRLCMWMPVAGAPEEKVEGSGEGGVMERKGEGGEEYTIPSHPALVLVSHCRQDFSRWSRRLLTFRRLGEGEVDAEALRVYRVARMKVVEEGEEKDDVRVKADDLNDFRRQYFQGFKETTLAAT